jgi:multicomponent Na+:H+ antiporter subunit C
MTWESLFAFAGVALFVLGLDAVIRHAHLMRKILGLNVMGSGVFLVIGALAQRAPDGYLDPVPQALVITGIVVAIAATALALGVMLKVVQATGSAELDGGAPRDDDP